MTQAPGTLLVVEDDDDLRDLLVLLLEQEGYAVRSAAHGQEALEVLARAESLPCVILLDLMMPVMNGWDFRLAQRRDPRLAEIPVVVFTGDRGARDSLQPLRPAAVFVKPMADIQPLLDTVRRLCGPRP